MDLIRKQLATVTMTSLELVDFVNAHRKESAEAAGAGFPSKGYAALQHKDFLEKVPAVLGATSAKFSADLPDGYGRPRSGYRFHKREACLMAMSYSYDLQAKVFDRMTALEQEHAAAPVLPNFANPADSARAWANQFEQTLIAEQERDLAIATKALIGSRREATAMATASAKSREVAALKEELGFNARHATILAVENQTSIEYAWAPMRKWCKANGVAPAEVPDKRFGTAKAWPAEAWLNVHGVDIQQIFKGGESG